MKKIMMTLSLLTLLLAAANSQAASIYTITLLGTPSGNMEYDKFISAEIKATLDVDANETTTLSIEVQNTSMASSWMTALAFSLPDGVTLDAAPNPLGWTYSESVDFSSGGGLKDYEGVLDAALLSGSTFTGGGNPKDGIANGTDWVEFAFTVINPGNISLDAEMFAPFLGRFQAVEIPEGFIPEDWPINADGSYAEGSTIATPTPIPGAAWLLGSGLVGLVGLRRRFSS
ncbi:MAG: hypothetical protein H0S80_04380 [Desulfovibrionaceae bacterium]|nr:hypothetical protein [Desulfovibrionaceae bacterium]